MTSPLWAILVPTIPQRQALLLRLLDALLPQLDEPAGAVRVIAWRNSGRPRLAEVRDALVATAGSDYVSFVDDDDLVSDDYVSRIVTAMHDSPAVHHVGFRVDYCVSGESREVVDHSLRWRRWHRTADGRLVRDFTHLDPVRRDIARRGRFAAAKPGRAEDRVWCRQIRPLLRTEAYVDRVLYRYLYSDEVTSWQHPERLVPAGGARPAIDHPYFSWHERSDP